MNRQVIGAGLALVMLAACSQDRAGALADAGALTDARPAAFPDSGTAALDASPVALADAAAAAAEDASPLEAGDAGRPADRDAGGEPDAAGAQDAAAADAGVQVEPDAAVEIPPDAGFTGCRADPPPGAALPPAWPTYAGTCPALTPVPAEVQLTSGGNDRKFKLVLPAAGPEPGERFALVFVWHWLWGSADDVVEVLQLQQAADERRIVFVVPVPKGDLPFRWPFLIVNSGDRIDEEIQFFDDMLACVAAAHPEINPGCVSSLGISAGALFTDQLAPRRSERLSSFLSISGGVGGTARGWDGASRHLPAVVLSGGDEDEYGGLYDFAEGSRKLEEELTDEGELFVECIHNCGHDVPPFPVPPGGTLFGSMWDFVLAHPYWVSPGTSPWQATGLPAGFPGWCGLGPGSATPRTDPDGC